MLDREYEQHLQSYQYHEHTVAENEKESFLWLITAATIIVPALIYINKI
ncbi:hypothetical protein JOC37_001653 [Desulfohalotomaculum tongense]|nr:hypothetical protein [Desulforadius tongensis]MBM7855260.1 hypothetical protein [Desulforadius tongensis]